MIIKNCPAYNNVRKNCNYKPWKDCQDCTNCVMKKIVEECKGTCRKRCTNDCLGTKKHCGYGQILQLLDIEEVE